MKKLFLLLMTLFFNLVLPMIVFAAEQEMRNVWRDFLSSWGPLILLIGVWLWYFRRYGGMKQGDYFKRTIEHMEKVEQLLERIAEAVERR